MNEDAIRADLERLAGHDVLLHGSIMGDHFTRRSDIDVAVVSRETDAAANRKLWMRLLGKAPDRYDIRVFELLPLPVQMQIADRHQVVFGDPVDISYYLYRFRRRWKDQAHRVRENRFTSIAEKRQALREARA